MVEGQKSNLLLKSDVLV